MCMQAAEGTLAVRQTYRRSHVDPPRGAGGNHGVRYSCAQLKATLSMMGCKARHAHKVRNLCLSTWRPQWHGHTHHYSSCAQTAFLGGQAQAYMHVADLTICVTLGAPAA